MFRIGLFLLLFGTKEHDFEGFYTYDFHWQHLHEVDIQAQSMVDAIVTRMAEIDGVTEELKANDQMTWVGLMNNYRHCAEDLVLGEVVYG